MSGLEFGGSEAILYRVTALTTAKNHSGQRCIILMPGDAQGQLNKDGHKSLPADGTAQLGLFFSRISISILATGFGHLLSRAQSR